MEEEKDLLRSSEASRAPAPDPEEGLSTPAAGPATYIGPTSSMRGLTMPSKHVGLQSHHEQVLSRGLLCVYDELHSCCEHAASCFECASSADDLFAYAIVFVGHFWTFFWSFFTLFPARGDNFGTFGIFQRRREQCTGRPSNQRDVHYRSHWLTTQGIDALPCMVGMESCHTHAQGHPNSAVSRCVIQGA